MDPKLCTVSDQSTQGAISHGIAPRTSAKNSVAVGGRAFSRASRWSDATAAATAATVPLRTNHHNLGLRHRHLVQQENQRHFPRVTVGTTYVTHQAAAAEPPCAAAWVRRSPHTLRQKKAVPAVVQAP